MIKVLKINAVLTPARKEEHGSNCKANCFSNLPGSLLDSSLSNFIIKIGNLFGRCPSPQEIKGFIQKLSEIVLLLYILNYAEDKNTLLFFSVLS